MQTLIVKTENESAAKFLFAFLKTVRFVKSVTIAPDESKTSVVNEPANEYNWINPTRPATDEEFEFMIASAEAEKAISAKEAKALTTKKIAQWKKQNLK